MRTAILPILALTAACGDNVIPAPGTETVVGAVCSEEELPALIRALPGAKHVLERPCGDYVTGQARCFSLELEQPIHHDAPSDGQVFDERAFLVHRGCDRPTVVADWGYANNDFFDDELTVLFRANALWLEHRFQGESLPLYDWDWASLTIENGANDMHRAIDAFKRIYGGRWVSTGASKGGITATYHRFFFPDDVDGSVPYVAPASRSRIDPEYQAYLKAALPEPCASRVRDAQVAALTTRRPMMIDRLSEIAGGFEADYLDMMTASLDWGFWQAWGINGCRDVPGPTASDDSFYAFFEQMSGFGPHPGDEQRSNGALSYEWLTQQGFALQIGDHVASLVQSHWATASMELRFREEFASIELPAYDNTTNDAVRAWVEHEAEDMLFLYGEVDPWSGGALPVPTRPSSARYFVPRANHGAQLAQLVGEARTDAFARVSEMFGEAPMMSLAARASEAASQRELRFRSAGIANAFLLLEPTGEVRCTSCSQDSPR